MALLAANISTQMTKLIRCMDIYKIFVQRSSLSMLWHFQNSEISE